MIVSSVLLSAVENGIRAELLPGLADGSLVGAVALGGSVEVRDGAAHGSGSAVVSGGLADVLLVAAGDDVAVVDCAGRGVDVEVPRNLDPKPAATPG